MCDLRRHGQGGCPCSIVSETMADRDLHIRHTYFIARRNFVDDNKPTPGPRALIQAARRRADRNTLSVYMQDHFDELRDEIGNRADWQLLATVFEGLSLRDARGQPPTPATARQTWYRLRNRRLTHPEQPARTVRSSVHLVSRKPDGHAPQRPVSPSSPRLHDHTASDNSVPSPDTLAGPTTAAEKIRRAQSKILADELRLPPRIEPKLDNH